MICIILAVISFSKTCSVSYPISALQGITLNERHLFINSVYDLRRGDDFKNIFTSPQNFPLRKN